MPFRIYKGSTVVNSCMATALEVAVLMIYICHELYLQPLSKEDLFKPKFDVWDLCGGVRNKKPQNLTPTTKRGGTFKHLEGMEDIV